MPMRTKCPSCQRAYVLADQFEGKKVQCKGCGKPFLAVPVLEEAGGKPAAPIVLGPPPVPKPAEPVQARRPRPRDEDDEDEAPRRRRRRREEDEDDDEGSGATKVWIFVGSGAGVLVIGLVMIFLLLGRSTVEVKRPEVAQNPLPPPAAVPAQVAPVQPQPQPQPRPQPQQKKVEKKVEPIRPVQPPAVRPVEPPAVKPVAPPQVDVGQPPVVPVAAERTEVRVVSWKVQPDPGPDMTKPVTNPKKVTPLGGIPEFVASTTPSPHLAVRHGLGLKTVWQVFNMQTLQQEAAFAGRLDIRDEVLSPDGKLMAGQENKGGETFVHVFSFAQKQYIRSVSLGARVNLRALDFVDNKHLLLVPHTFGTRQAEVKVVSIDSGMEVKQIAAPQDGRLDRKELAQSPGRKYLAIGANRSVAIHETLTGERVAELTLGEDLNHPRGMAFSPDGTEFALLFENLRGDRLVSFDVAKGEKKMEHTFTQRVSSIPNLFRREHPLRWIPDRSGWLLYDTVWVDYESGYPVQILAALPNENNKSPRLMLGKDHVITSIGSGVNYVLGTWILPKTEIAAAVAKARAGGGGGPAALPKLTPADFAAAKTLPPLDGVAPWKATADPALLNKVRLLGAVTLKSPPNDTLAIAFSAPETPQAFALVSFAPNPLAASKVLRLDRYDLATGKSLGSTDLFALESDEKRQAAARPRRLGSREPQPFELRASPDATRILLHKNTSPERLDIFSADGKHVVGWQPGEKDNGTLEDADFVSADHVLTRSDQGKVVLWKIPECKALYEIGGISGSFKLSANRKFFLAHADNSLELFDSMTAERLGSLDAPASGKVTALHAAAFSPDGQQLAALANLGTSDYLVKWSLLDGKSTGDLPAVHHANRSLTWAGPHHQMYGEELFDWNLRGILWAYFLPSHGNPNTIQGTPDGRRWIQMNGPKGINVLAVVNAPDPKAQEAANLVAKGGLQLAFPKGTAVQVDVNAGGYSDAIRKTMEEFLLEKGYTIGPGGLVATVSAAENPTGRNLEFRLIGRFGAGMQRITIQDRVVKCEGEVKDPAGRSIAKFQNSIGLPHFVSFKTEEYDRELTERMWESTRTYFRGTLQLQNFYRVNGELLTFPQRTFLSLK